MPSDPEPGVAPDPPSPSVRPDPPTSSGQKVPLSTADEGGFCTLDGGVGGGGGGAGSGGGGAGGGAGAGAEVLLMLLADARLPTGAHTQSAGLEPAMRQGLSLAQVPGYIRTRLRTVVAVEAGAAVVARHVAIAGTDDGADGLRAVDDAWRARTISPALRENAEALGRGYARLVAGLWPQQPAAQALRAVRRPTRAVAIGVAGALAGLTAAQVARLIGYDDAQTVAAAALKLDPLDPLVATGWVVQVAGDIERMADAVATLTSPDQIPATTAPLIEQWAQVHAVTGQRLFRA